MTEPAVSVVIPTYNRSGTIRRAVDSVLAAISPSDEVIIVDDGSSDDTDRVLAAYGDEVRYVRTPNGGAGRARNRGIEEARHSLVAFLDSDDEWMPDRLLLGRRLLGARPDVLFCFSDFGNRRAGQPDGHRGLIDWHRDRRSWDQILGPGVPYSRIAELPTDRRDFAVHVGDLYPQLLDANYVASQTLLARRDEAGTALRFGEDLDTYEDWECAARLARAGKAAYLDCETAWQWGHQAPRLTDTDQFRATGARLTIIERIWARDPDFLARDPERVARLVRSLDLVRARWLLRSGRNKEARLAFERAGGAPFLQRLLASLPGFIARDVFAARTLYQRILRRITT